ncbi:3-keto-disaccharide hydrolase [Zavarzinella formosa]|uniref:3-keto-disaccharide hydrolase n=1 Tax=Zavarzinella formosa TaxID=360055 RepID=UPI000319CC7A|nr:DUF1080 domain-containing protein [Zavarzinella formosa]
MRHIRSLLLLVAATISLPACAEDKAGPKDNMPPEGFVALFNGKDLTGWKGHIDMNERKKPEADQAKLQEARNKLMAETWTVKDGIIHHNPKVNEKGQKSGVSLQTVKDYGDIELMVDWKIEKAGDSGLYLRGNPQVQIWDSENLSPSLKADANTGSGGLWNNPVPAGATPQSVGKVPLKKADKPVGEWNTFKIVMKGDKVTIHLNDVLVVDNAPLNNYWEKGKPLPATGPFELQYHGDKLWFKNIFIKELK